MKTIYLAGAALALAACSPQQPTVVQAAAQPTLYQNIDQCVAAGNQPSVCQAAMQSGANDPNAPRYVVADQCYSIYGPTSCHYYNGSWMPFMAGFMLGGGGYNHYYPVYHTVHGGYYANGRSMNYAPRVYHTTNVYVNHGASSATRAPMPAYSRPTTTYRGTSYSAPATRPSYGSTSYRSVSPSTTSSYRSTPSYSTRSSYSSSYRSSGRH